MSLFYDMCILMIAREDPTYLLTYFINVFENRFNRSKSVDVRATCFPKDHGTQWPTRARRQFTFPIISAATSGHSSNRAWENIRIP